jgi:iron complex transport system permease protein
MNHRVVKRTLHVSFLLCPVLMASIVLGLCMGSTGQTPWEALAVITGQGNPDSVMASIIWRIRFPRVVLASLVGATLSLGGLVFQTLLRNPIAEPYVLGISGGSAVGAILGILLGLSRFPGVASLAFAGSTITLLLVLTITWGQSAVKKDSLILAGVMVNAFCSSIIMFLVSLTRDSRLHNILFWLMGDLSITDTKQVLMLSVILVPCFVLLFLFANSMNLLLMGEEMAAGMGVDVRCICLALLGITSLMVSSTVCHSGLLGFVGLVIPHLLRLLVGADHRVLIPSCVFGGAAYLVLCDLLARSIPAHGEMPVGVVTAMIGAPLFIFLLARSRR